ncbi:MAG TPA: hypothetical protein VGV59_02355, partial [Pyrinomonadaceae bacterium]|nr:hypothetical protein [Pyrinomonadaceae bacterium]
MLRRTRIARLDRAAVTRKLTATLLMLALVSAFAPFASALSHAKMPCCEMAAHHEEGGAECVGHSCHTKPATPKKAAKKAEKKETEPSDPMCGTEQAAATTTHAKPQHAAHHAKHTQHAAPSATRQDADDVSSHPPASQDAAQDSSEASAAHTSSSHSHDATA